MEACTFGNSNFVISKLHKWKMSNEAATCVVIARCADLWMFCTPPTLLFSNTSWPTLTLKLSELYSLPGAVFKSVVNHWGRPLTRVTRSRAWDKSNAWKFLSLITTLWKNLINIIRTWTHADLILIYVIDTHNSVWKNGLHLSAYYEVYEFLQELMSKCWLCITRRCRGTHYED